MARTKSNGVNKADLVRKALEQLGDNAKPKAIQELLKMQHGIDMNTGMISAYKSNAAKKAAGAGASTSSAGRKRVGADSVNLSDLHAVQELLHRMGPDHLTQLIKLLGK